MKQILYQKSQNAWKFLRGRKHLNLQKSSGAAENLGYLHVFRDTSCGVILREQLLGYPPKGTQKCPFDVFFVVNIYHFCGCCFVCVVQLGMLPLQTVTTRISAPRKFNSSPLQIGNPKRKLIFQPSFFRGYLTFRGCTFLIGNGKLNLHLPLLLSGG